MERSATRTARRRLLAVIAAGALSNLAEGLGGLALLWYVLQSAESAAAVGALAALSLGAMVVGLPVGGILVDRYGARRSAMIGSLAGAVPVVALALLTSQAHVMLGLVLGLVLLAQLPDGAVVIALEARLPEMTAAAHYPLERINAIDDVVDGVSGVAAAPLAGLTIAALGVSFTLWLALGCGLAAMLLALASLPADDPRSSPHLEGGAMQGFRMIAGERSALPLVVMVALLIAAFDALEEVIVPVLVVKADLGPTGLGNVMAMAGIGALLGAAIYLVISRWARAGTVFMVAVLVLLAALLAIAFQPSRTVLLVTAFFAGTAAGAISPIVTTRLQRLAPAAVRGRFLGAIGALVIFASPFVSLLAGGALDRVGVEAVLFALAALCATCAVAAGLFPRALE